MKGSDNQEKLVYQIIEDAGNKGDKAELCPCFTRFGLQEVVECYVPNVMCWDMGVGGREGSERVAAFQL